MARLHRKVCTRCVISFGIIASQVAVRRHHPVFQAEKKRHDVFTSHMVRQAFGPSMAAHPRCAGGRSRNRGLDRRKSCRQGSAFEYGRPSSVAGVMMRAVARAARLRAVTRLAISGNGGILISKYVYSSTYSAVCRG